MANEKLIKIIKEEGIVAWNKWRKIHSDAKIDLIRANLRKVDLHRADLRKAELYKVNFFQANLIEVDLTKASLREGCLIKANLKDANLTRADLYDVDLTGANLTRADLIGAFLMKAELIGANLTRADLRGADLRGVDLTRADLIGADLRGVNLTEAKLDQADLIGADLRGVDLTGIDLTGADLRGANLTKAKLNQANLHRVRLDGANLTGFDLTGFDLTGFDLSRACLKKVNFSEVKALKTNFNSANLTGACIQDWNINSETNLDNIICEYIYLKGDQQERRPSDPNRNFEPGEFTKLFRKAIETVDLVFLDGINWEAFLLSLKDLQNEYGQENVDVQGIERKSLETFVVHLVVTSEINKGEIEDKVKQFYETKLQILEARYRAELQAKDREIEIHKKQGSDMTEIVKLLANKPITVEAKAVAENTNIQGDKNMNDNRKITTRNYTEGDSYQTTNINDQGINVEGDYYNNAEVKQNLAEAAKEIQALLNQLSETYPSETKKEKRIFAAEAIEVIEQNPSLTKKLLSAIKAGSVAALESMLNHPAASFVIAALEDLEESKN